MPTGEYPRTAPKARGHVRSPNTSYRSFTVRIDPETAKQVNDFAVASRCSTAEALRQLVETGLEELSQTY